MTSTQQLKIVLNDKEKQALKDAAEVMKELKTHLVANYNNGWTPFQSGMNINCDAFWDIYNICIAIDENDLIP